MEFDNKLVAFKLKRLPIFIRLLKEVGCNLNHVDKKEINQLLKDIIYLRQMFTIPKARMFRPDSIIYNKWQILCLFFFDDYFNFKLTTLRYGYNKINCLQVLIDEYNKQHNTSYDYNHGLYQIILNIKKRYTTYNIYTILQNIVYFSIDWEKSYYKKEFWDKMHTQVVQLFHNDKLNWNATYFDKRKKIYVYGKKR